MSFLISTGDLRGIKFYLAEMANCNGTFYTSLWYVYCELPKGQKKKIVLAYKGCVAIQICHWLCTYGTTKVMQERRLARNDFDHEIII